VTKKEVGTDLASALKEQLALMTVLVLFAGLVSTETYYAAFGIRYQLLELSVSHLVSRGMTAVLDSPFLLVAYVAALFWLSFGAGWFGARRPSWSRLVQPATYGLVFAIIVVAYLTSVSAGRDAARRDLGAMTSLLPVVQAMKSTDGRTLPYVGYRLLTAGNETVVVFKPIGSPAESPFIHLLKREDVGDITITR
jgi:hypothetical protein